MSHVLSAVIHAARDISDVAFIVELPVCITTSPSWDALQVMSSDTAVFKKIPKLHWLVCAIMLNLQAGAAACVEVHDSLYINWTTGGCERPA